MICLIDGAFQGEHPACYQKRSANMVYHGFSLFTNLFPTKCMYSVSNLGGERNRQTTQVYKAVSKQTGKVLGAKREVLLEVEADH